MYSLITCLQFMHLRNIWWLIQLMFLWNFWICRGYGTLILVHLVEREMLVTIVVYSKELCVNYSVKGNEYILVFVFYTKFYFVILFNSIEHLVEVKKIILLNSIIQYWWQEHAFCFPHFSHIKYITKYEQMVVHNDIVYNHSYFSIKHNLDLFRRSNIVFQIKGTSTPPLVSGKTNMAGYIWC